MELKTNIFHRVKNFPAISLLIIFHTIFLSGKPASGALNPAQEPLRGEINRGIELTINNRFDEAIALYRQLIEIYPRQPIGYFYTAATLQAKMLDAEDYSEQDEFYRLSDLAIRHAKELRRTGKATGWTVFYEGSAYLYRSFMDSKKGKWFAAYKDAKRGVGRLEEAVALDSSLYDAYLGLGSFKYWKSAKANFLLWLPFISDERKTGIEMIRQSIAKGTFTYWIARDQLSWVLMDAGNYPEAMQIARENSEAYPESRFFKWTLVEAAYRSHDLNLCYRLYRELLQSVQKISNNNHYNELECLVRLAEIDLERQQWQQAHRYSDRALRLLLAKEIRKRVKGKLKRAMKVRQQAEKALQHHKNDS